MLVKVEARILIFPGTDFHFPSTSVPPGTFFKALSKIQIGFTFLVPAHLGSPGKGPLNGCVCVCVCCGSVLLWRRCDTICTSGFMDDVVICTQWPGIGDVSKAHTQSNSTEGSRV